MRWLRYLLIAASLGTAAFLTYICVTEQVHAPWTVASWIAASILNAGYLSWAGPPKITPRRFRILGLFGLWLDAKESELKARANRRDAPNDQGTL
jgi:hypothetical protein